MPIVSVNVQPSAYDVTVELGVLAEIGPRLGKLCGTKKAAVLTDSNVGPLHAKKLVASLRGAGIEPVMATIPAGEQHKSLATLLPVYDTLLAARVERSTPVLALGGGVLGDMAGLVAATVLRGVPFVQVPTTLLAMVDASVGGKVGVDTAHGKNLIGAFHQPIGVFADPQMLTTLPKAELHGGLAECIKHDIIRDAAGFADLERNIDKALGLDLAYLTQLVAHNVAIKARVVELDPFERGDRAHLNLGHTFGHAIEAISNFEIPHGPAVSLGIVAATYCAVELKLLTAGDRQRILALLSRAQLPTSGLKLDPAAVHDAMFSDKKVKAGKLRIILPEGIGKAVIRDDLPRGMILDAIGSLR